MAGKVQDVVLIVFNLKAGIDFEREFLTLFGADEEARSAHVNESKTKCFKTSESCALSVLYSVELVRSTPLALGRSQNNDCNRSRFVGWPSGRYPRQRASSGL